LESNAPYEQGNDKIMKKNKNIFLHIIEENYREKSQNQMQCFDVSEKAVLLTDTKDKTSSLFEQLEKLHEPIVISSDPESKQLNPELNDMDHQSVFKTMRSIDDLELSDFFQEMKSEEIDPLDKIEEQASREQNRQERLLEEISEKKKAIEALRSEILNLQNSCRELSQELSNTN